LGAAAVEQEVAAGTVIIREGDEADALWILVSGTLAIQALGPDGSTVELPDVDAPSYVGELGLLHGRPRSATVTVKQDATLLRIDGKEFLNALEAAPPSVSLKTLAGVRLARTPARDDVQD
ncbi:MAG TPA: cyclic nucleotide-binding domain-containing protein, partial [Acidothermaceae bacterium]